MENYYCIYECDQSDCFSLLKGYDYVNLIILIIVCLSGTEEVGWDHMIATIN